MASAPTVPESVVSRVHPSSGEADALFAKPAPRFVGERNPHSVLFDSRLHEGERARRDRVAARPTPRHSGLIDLDIVMPESERARRWRPSESTTGTLLSEVQETPITFGPEATRTRALTLLLLAVAIVVLGVAVAVLGALA